MRCNIPFAYHSRVYPFISDTWGTLCKRIIEAESMFRSERFTSPLVAFNYIVNACINSIFIIIRQHGRKSPGVIIKPVVFMLMNGGVGRYMKFYGRRLEEVFAVIVNVDPFSFLNNGISSFTSYNPDLDICSIRVDVKFILTAYPVYPQFFCFSGLEYSFI